MVRRTVLAQPVSTPSSRARRVLERKPRFQGWPTTDEEEIERRQARAAGEPIEIEEVEPQELVFGTYRVGSAGGGHYHVEIRCLSERDNSCDCLSETAPQPEVMVLDRASFEAVERMIEAGLLERTAAGRRLLHRSRSLQDPATGERRRRLEQARELLEQARRKVHMAAVLAGGGFPVEALAPLREGIETGLRYMALGADAGESATASREVSMSWIEAHRERLDGAGLDAPSVDLVARLRGGPETLLGVGEDEARSWVERGQRLAARVGESLDQATSRPG
jgi:hypothetical protein